MLRFLSIILSLLLLSFNQTFAQFKLKPSGKEITVSYKKTIASKINIYAPVKVIYKIDPTKKNSSIKITGYENIIKNIKITANNGVISIKWVMNSSIERKNFPTINLTTPELSGISLSKTAYFYSLSPLQVNTLSITVSGASTLKIPDIAAKMLSISVSGASEVSIINLRSADKLKLNITGASDVYIEGKNVNYALVNISSSSDLKMEGVIVKEMNITVDDTSDAYVNVSDKINAVATGESEITILGKPKHISKSESGMSDIKVK